MVYRRFGKCMGTLGGHKGSFIRGLGSVWDFRGSYGVIYMRFGKCMGPYEVHRGSFK